MKFNHDRGNVFLKLSLGNQTSSIIFGLAGASTIDLMADSIANICSNLGMRLPATERALFVPLSVSHL